MTCIYRGMHISDDCHEIVCTGHVHTPLSFCPGGVLWPEAENSCPIVACIGFSRPTGKLGAQHPKNISDCLCEPFHHDRTQSVTVNKSVRFLRTRPP